MARSGSYTYNPETGEWTRNNDGGGSSSGGGSSNSPSSGGSDTSGGSPSSSGGDNLTANSTDKDSSSGIVEKQYNTIEINTLSGTLSFIVTNETIKLKAGETVKLNGLGKYLSGNYFVKDVTRQISSQGYSHSATLVRTDVGNSLKSSTTTTAKVTKPKPAPQKEQSSPQAATAQRTYTVKKGDCLWNIAKMFYGNGASWGKIYDANTGQIANPNLIYPGQVFVIP